MSLVKGYARCAHCDPFGECFRHAPRCPLRKPVLPALLRPCTTPGHIYAFTTTPPMCDQCTTPDACCTPIDLATQETPTVPDTNPKAARAIADGKAPLHLLDTAMTHGAAEVLATDPKRSAAASKPQLDLLERGFLEAVARAMQSGCDKYGRRSYADGGKLSTYVGAVLRHALAFSAGEDLDPESGIPHTAHLGASAMILHTLYEAGAEDDRLVVPAVSPEYAAGLLDGEGHIGLIDPRPAQRIYSRVGIQMTVRAPLDRMVATYGGNVGLYTKKPARYKPIYVWVCPRGTTESLLQDTLPHLCVKHEQAQLVLDWFAVRLTGQECYERDDDPGAELSRRCAELNRRGVVPPSCPLGGDCSVAGRCATPCKVLT